MCLSLSVQSLVPDPQHSVNEIHVIAELGVIYRVGLKEKKNSFSLDMETDVFRGLSKISQIFYFICSEKNTIRLVYTRKYFGTSLTVHGNSENFLHGS